jgi:PAS domain S-box-containing protein
MAQNKPRRHPRGKIGKKDEERSGLAPQVELCPIRSAKTQPYEDAKYQALVETLPVAVIMVRDGRILFANPAAANILGFRECDELIGASLLQFVPASEQSRIARCLERRLSCDAEAAECFDTVFLRVDSREFPAEVRIKAFTVREWAVLQLVVTDLTERRHAETHLTLLSQALEQASEGMAVLDLRGCVTFSNRALGAMHGYNSEDLIGKHWSLLHSPSHMLSLAAAEWTLRRTGRFSGEVWHLRRDGTEFPALVLSSVLCDDQGRRSGTVHTVRDITEMKATENILQRSHDKMSKDSSVLQGRVVEASKDLELSRQELEEYSQRLEKANRALKLLMESADDRRRDLENTIHSSLKTTIFPILDQMKAENHSESVKYLLHALEYSLTNFFSVFGSGVAQEVAMLTPKEARLCELIRSGLTSKQVAEIMGISPSTVIVHRTNIRRKLGLAGSQDNLSTYLRAKF